MKYLPVFTLLACAVASCKLDMPDEAIVGQFKYIGNYNVDGRPHYLDPQPDTVGPELLEIIDICLPPGRSVPQFHPEYLKDDRIANINLIADADLWVTFVDEGASYANAIGYYTYPTDMPPTRVEDVSNLHIIFPNLSLVGSGGQLMPGDKVHLGRFSAGTSVGWFLVPDGWNKKTQNVDMKPGIKFSDKILNTFTQAQYSQHMTLLCDLSLQKLILGMEDISRPDGDNDFNDAVFYVTANPFEAIQNERLAVPQL